MRPSRKSGRPKEGTGGQPAACGAKPGPFRGFYGCEEPSCSRAGAQRRRERTKPRPLPVAAALREIALALD
jgi:hypothetical protein